MDHTVIDAASVHGHGTWTLYNSDSSVADSGAFTNLVTQVGIQYYAERAAAISGAPAVITGMKLGTGTTAPTSTGGPAALITYLTNSHQGLDSGFPTSSLVTISTIIYRRIQYQVTFLAGKATSAVTPIAEAVLVNTTLTDATSAASATISRALISPTITKAADQILVVTWNHDFLAT